MGFICFTFLLGGCTVPDQRPRELPEEMTLDSALEAWPEMPQQITFIGLRECLTKFQIYWNGAISCFVGRDCFGQLFPPQRALALEHEREQLHLTFAGGQIPAFAIIDSGQIAQSLLDGYLPVVRSDWETEGIAYSMQTAATSLIPEELDPGKVAGLSLALVRVTLKIPANFTGREAHFWMNLSGYRTLVPTMKELPDDRFPEYGVPLHLEGNTLLDTQHRIRVCITEVPPGTRTEFHRHFSCEGAVTEELKRSERKGFLKNLLHLAIPCTQGDSVSLVLALPYFPVEKELAPRLERKFSTELERIKDYWGYYYERDAVLETPDPFVNNFYKSGLWRTLVTSDRDPATGLVYVKSSPAWYETIWPNCAMVSALSMDMRGFHRVAQSYLEPFLGWQSVREPPHMEGASGEGFLCPPSTYCAIPWVSNHGTILYAISEHYRMTGDREWAEMALPVVLHACEWISEHRNLPSDDTTGTGLLPGGTVSDDRGSGQYLSSDAQNYRGMKSAARFLSSVESPRASEILEETRNYRDAIREALFKQLAVMESVSLKDGSSVPYVPSEIHQTAPPSFDPNDFWPFINYVDVGPMYLVDCQILEASEDAARWILQFESEYPVALLDHPISLTENWVRSIKLKGEFSATLLHEGVSTVEPFYSPRSTYFLENDEIENYLGIFYHQLASGVSHKNMAPCENRYGVWNMPWADGEFHRMLLRMLVDEQADTLVLLKAVPRRWLRDGEEIRIERQPTPFGKIGLVVRSHLDEGYINLDLHPPTEAVPGGISIRMRHPEGRSITSVELNGMKWKQFSNEYLYLGNLPEGSNRVKVIF